MSKKCQLFHKCLFWCKKYPKSLYLQVIKGRDSLYLQLAKGRDSLYLQLVKGRDCLYLQTLPIVKGTRIYNKPVDFVWLTKSTLCNVIG